MFLLAQDPPNPALWEEVVKGLAGNGLWIFLSVVFLLWSIETVSRQFMRHRERMAMIEAGMYPDKPAATASPDVDPEQAGVTIDLRKSG